MVPRRGRRDRPEGLPGAELLTDGLVKRRVTSGVFFIGSWGVLNLVVGFFGNLALARMLLPRDFGIVAIGATLMMFTTALADGGLGSGLIRREEPPTRRELRAALGLQLTLTGALAAVAAAVASSFGHSGLVVALMMIALPVASLPTPGRIVLSRALRFRTLATVEATGMLFYYAWAVGGVVAGLGVWALASAVIVKAAVTAVGVAAVSGLGPVLPSYRGVRALRPVVAFGLRFQAVSLAGMGREQGLNAGVAAISGVSTLGLWTLTKRLLELPALMFEPLHRVSFPYLSRVVAAGKDPSHLLDRGVAMAGALSGLVLVGTAVAAPELVPAMFGEQWLEVAVILQLVCVALLVAGPVAVAGVGYLYAVGAPSVVLWATILHTGALFLVAFTLLPFVGPAAIGLGSLSGAIVDVLVMDRALRRRTDARPLRRLLPVLLVAGSAAALGLFVAEGLGANLLSGLAGSVAAGLAYIVLLTVLQRDVVLDASRQVAAAARNALTREERPPGRQPEGDAPVYRPEAGPARSS